MNAAWLERLRARADQPPLRPRVPLRLASAVIGSVEPGLGDQLAAAGLPVAATGDAVVLQGEADA